MPKRPCAGLIGSSDAGSLVRQTENEIPPRLPAVLWGSLILVFLRQFQGHRLKTDAEKNASACFSEALAVLESEPTEGILAAASF